MVEKDDGSKDPLEKTFACKYCAKCKKCTMCGECTCDDPPPKVVQRTSETLTNKSGRNSIRNLGKKNKGK